MRMWMVYTDPVQVTDESIGSLQREVNGFLRKLGRRPEFRVVDQSIQACTVYDSDDGEFKTSFTGIIWYEKVRKEADA